VEGVHVNLITPPSSGVTSAAVRFVGAGGGMLSAGAALARLESADSTLAALSALTT
jgi:hypothetical protein